MAPGSGERQRSEPMAFNKSKALEIALKLLSQGKVTQAIAEYQQILRNDPKDQATLMTVGDLFARQGDMPHAIEYFERLAQVYLHDGFNSKAIAIYKKIAKLAPAELAPLERLAELYVQQGVLSEARPLFLQIAEAHLKANRAPKAVEVLRHLLEVEPENPRIQMRLAELYNVMGQKKEAAHTFFAYAQRLFERGDVDEAQKLIERALGVDLSHAAALLLKARILGMTRRDKEAILILEGHPDADAGGEATNLLVDLELRAGQNEKAADRARNQLVRGNAHFGLLHRVAETLTENGHPGEALALLRELRDPMIDEGQQDKFLKSLSGAVERLPGQAEPLEMLAEFCRHTSDPFHLTTALAQLVDIHTAAGNGPRAIALLEELVERNKDDERLVARLERLRESTGILKAEPEPGRAAVETSGAEAGVPGPAFRPIVEEPLDEETDRYVAQALTDVDLFSSYGLTHKATHLLERVIERAPRHTPTLERLLDVSLGAGDDRRTAELAAQLEHIYRERGDNPKADRAGELRQRFERVAELGSDELRSAPLEAAPIASAEPLAAIEAVHAPIEAPEFEIAPSQPESEAFSDDGFEAPSDRAPEPTITGEEVDLSDEWEAIAQEASELPQPRIEGALELPAEDRASADVEAADVAIEPAPEPEVFEIEELAAEPPIEPALDEAFQPIETSAEEPASAEQVAAEPGDDSFELELTPEPAEPEGQAESATTDDFLTELAAEIEGLEPLRAEPAGETAGPEALAVPLPEPAPAPPTAETLNQLADVFQEFRTELGELGEEDEDLETHYSLGIAYREMGLLDEAIGEFQKVAKAVQTGKPFRYAMNCSTLLAVTFLDKGEPKIASLWYQRALEVPGLDPETILALRYDLGVSLETAGESDAALDSFRQVYAMNIDYRDVADRIATLQHHSAPS
jgi:tetratricopeptide (TPR) repeat protein